MEPRPLILFGAEGDNHRTIETTNTFKVTSRDLSDVNVSIKAKTYNDKKKVTIDKNIHFSVYQRQKMALEDME